MRGLVNTVSSKRLDALEDFQSLYKTDADIFPLQMVKWLVDSLPEAERLQVSPSLNEAHCAAAVPAVSLAQANCRRLSLWSVTSLGSARFGSRCVKSTSHDDDNNSGNDPPRRTGGPS